MTDTEPEIGDRVTFIDGDGEEHRAVVVDDVPDAEYITLVWGGDQGELGEEYHSKVETETSIYPHADLDEEYTATGHAFKPGWE